MAKDITSVLTAASRQWATRPDDQRYLSLEELRASVELRKRESWTATPKTSDLRVYSDDNNEVAVEVFDPTAGQRRQLKPTNFAFGQLAQYASAPASYLRTLPAELAAINLQWGWEHNAMRDDSLALARSNGTHELRALTSTSYGRIWDLDVVKAVQNVNTDGRWKVPAASYSTKNPRRATTLYGSDRDVFIFLVDDAHPIEVPGDPEPLYRGFYTWNSEVGAATFGLATFLYRYVCDNRMIWGATNVQELRIRHTGGAPERFAHEGAKYLRRYSDEATAGMVEQITRAKALELPEAKKADTLAEWMQKRGFTRAVAKASIDAAVAEEGQHRSLWDIVNGVTAYARSITHTDSRVAIETQAGKLMEMVK